MRDSPGVRDGILRFYERFSAADPDAFAQGIADVPGVSVIGTAPGEGHDNRQDWVDAYRDHIAPLGLRLEGEDPRGFEEGSFGFATDTPSFVMPDGSRLSTRLTAVLTREDGDWKVVHLHFSVGVPDEDATEQPGGG